MRFDHSVRTLASVLFVISTLLYVSNQVTGMELHKIYPVICLVCIFYTTLEGFKAVVLMDSLQFTVTKATMATVLGMGTYSPGSFGAIWEKATQGDRLEFFNMNMDPTGRTTFWTIVVGMTTYWIANLGVNPSSIQRYLVVPSYGAANKSVWVFGVTTVTTKIISCFSGPIMYAKYVSCDSLSSGRIKRSDPLLPYYVLDDGGQ